MTTLGLRESLNMNKSMMSAHNIFVMQMTEAGSLLLHSVIPTSSQTAFSPSDVTIERLTV